MRQTLLAAVVSLCLSAFSYANPLASTMEELSPTHRTFVFDIDQTSFQFIPGFAQPATGSVNAHVELVPSGGCSGSDFVGFTPGDIALIERGSCPFNIKGDLAESAGASGFIVFDNIVEQLKGNVFVLGIPGPSIPGLFVTEATGNTLIGDLGPSLIVQFSVFSVPEPASLLLLGSGMLGLGGLARKRMKKG